MGRVGSNINHAWRSADFRERSIDHLNHKMYPRGPPKVLQIEFNEFNEAGKSEEDHPSLFSWRIYLQTFGINANIFLNIISSIHLSILLSDPGTQLGSELDNFL